MKKSRVQEVSLMGILKEPVAKPVEQPEVKAEPVSAMTEGTSRIDVLIEKLCPDGIRFCSFKECIKENIGGGTPAKNNPNYWNGNIPWASVKDLVKCTDFLRKTEDSITDEGLKNSPSNIITKGNLIIATRISCGKVIITDIDVAINQDLRGIILSSCVLEKYIMYYFQTLSIEGTGTTVKGISVQELENIKIPVPPLPVQEEIVRILDTFAKMTAELTAELTKRKQQYQYYRDNIFNIKNVSRITFPFLQKMIDTLCPSGIQYKKMGDVITFINGRAYKQQELLDVGKYKVLRVGNFYTNDKWYYSDLELDNEKYCNKGDLLYSWAAGLGAHIWDGEKTIFHYHIWKLVYDNNILMKRFLYHYLNYDVGNIQGSLTQSTMVHISMENMKSRVVPVPPIEVQQYIVSILDRFDTLCNDITSGLPAEIEARKKQYEYYRDKLLAFKEAGK